MISKTKISKRTWKKTNPELVETIMLAKKYNQIEIAKILSGPTRARKSMNLKDINKKAKENETIIVPGKVLGDGEIKKKIKIIALDFSSSAEEKLKKTRCEIKKLKEELEKNKKLEGRVLK